MVAKYEEDVLIKITPCKPLDLRPSPAINPSSIEIDFPLL